MDRQIELSCVFEKFRSGIDDFEEAKKWKEIEEIARQEVGGTNYQQCKKKMEMIRGGVFGKGGERRGSERKPDTTENKWRKFGEC